MYYDKSEDDEERPRITPYNAFDVILQLTEVSNSHEARINLAWDNLSNLNPRLDRVSHDIMLLKQAYLKQKNEIDNLKMDLIPLLLQLQAQVEQLTFKENTNESGK